MDKLQIRPDKKSLMSYGFIFKLDEFKLKLKSSLHQDEILESIAIIVDRVKQPSFLHI